VNRALAVGYSQTARVLKTMMIEGFNRVDGRRVFDGIHVQAGQSALASILATGAGPVSSTDSPTYLTGAEKLRTCKGLRYGAKSWGIQRRMVRST
jgi:hypothetical protein